ncbi:MAG: formylglycine-generating enzyme family protein [Chitinivibrionales bacterium]|nr:formylglycine-generating enzyme family protein [Chitinivibrionales bacterium]
MKLTLFKSIGSTVCIVLAYCFSYAADYPLWDGKETVAAYASRTNLKASDTLNLGNNVKMIFNLIPAGRFTMGTPKTEPGQYNGPDAFELSRTGGEQPQHEVTISKPFYMGKYEVRQDEYTAVLPNASPTYGQPLHADWPASGINWPSTQRFCTAVKTKTGREVRLPTEAEWEYACRAGTTTMYYNGATMADLSKIAWFGGYSKPPEPSNSPDTNNHPVGGKDSNAFGLYDMLGNVGEWCNDWWGKTYYGVSPSIDPPGPAEGDGVCDNTRRVCRGGAVRNEWIAAESDMRCGFRGGNHCVDAPYDDRFGFRVAVSVSASSAVRRPAGIRRSGGAESSKIIGFYSIDGKELTRQAAAPISQVQFGGDTRPNCVYIAIAQMSDGRRVASKILALK